MVSMPHFNKTQLVSHFFKNYITAHLGVFIFSFE